MYTLRIIEEVRKSKDQPFEQVIENFEIGDAYTVIKKGSSSEYSDIVRRLFPEEDDSDVDKIVCGENRKTFFAYVKTDLRNHAYFIMTESGKTFERL